MRCRKLLIASLVATLPIALLAGCGGAAGHTGTSTTPQLGPPPPTVGPATAGDLSAVRQAAAHTLTQRAAVAVELASPPSVPYPPVTAKGTFDLETGSGQALATDPVGTESLVFTPTQIFDRRPPAELAGLPQGRPWIKTDLSERLTKSSFLAGFVQRLQQHDPNFLLGEIAWGALDAAPLGSSTVNGVKADGYLVHVDPARAAAAASGPGARSFVRMAALARQELGAGLGAPPAIRVWVDPSGRVVSARAETISSAAGSGGGTLLMTLSSFGKPVRLSPPGAAQTVDLAALVGADNDHD